MRQITLYHRHGYAPPATEKWLDDRDIPFETVDATTTPGLNEFFQARGMFATPVVIVDHGANMGQSSFCGFQPHLLEALCVEVEAA